MSTRIRLQQPSGWPRRALALLPLAFALHVAEEWFGGFTNWTADVMGRELTAARFLIINAIAVTVAAVFVAISLRNARWLFPALVVAGVLTLNGALHVMATLGWGVYSPGVVTGLLLYLPLGGSVLLWASRLLSGSMFGAVLVSSIVVHALVVLLAFFVPV